MRAANDLLAFVLELAALAALAVWGFTVGPNLIAAVVLGLGAPALLAVGWGTWLAPKSARRVPMPWRLVAKLAVFAVASAALAAAGHAGLTLVLAAVAVVNLALATVWGRA
ncbi:YrdB family protein [Pseudonocardia nigra]|uniref:YrdB family protein n=1 Tax=Pseudonocardia nigra TaxID=1921578 RepID=UPI001C5FA7FF|nr:YrdB family protein [Pseudonocardia nigra]